MNEVRKLPQYRSHKTVSALKIKSLERIPGGLVIMHPAESGYPDIQLSQYFMDRHKPEVGGYYVIYEDGYTSFSPAKPFEDGYTRI